MHAGLTQSALAMEVAVEERGEPQCQGMRCQRMLTLAQAAAAHSVATVVAVHSVAAATAAAAAAHCWSWCR